uniref:Uncharacterized protein n=1 Tax=Caenorhabditis japonica TaxID=281687 RepID=A0A8R1IAS8_CAEJA
MRCVCASGRAYSLPPHTPVPIQCQLCPYYDYPSFSTANSHIYAENLHERVKIPIFCLYSPKTAPNLPRSPIMCQLCACPLITSARNG